MLLRPASFALMAGLALGAPSALAAPEKPVAAQVETTQAPKAAPQADTSTYAQREKQDQKAANFQGGDTVVIAMSGAAFVLLLFLLLLI